MVVRYASLRRFDVCIIQLTMILVAIFQQTKRCLHAGHPARSGTIVWLRAA